MEASVSGPTENVLGHDLAHASGDRAGIDHALDRGPAVCFVGASASAGRPQGWFASRGPEGKVSHARQPVEVDAAHRPQAMHHRIE